MRKAENQTPTPHGQTVRTPGADTSRPAIPGSEGVGSASRGGDGLAAFPAAADVDRRADVTLAMQRAGGNRTVTRMIGQAAARTRAPGRDALQFTADPGIGMHPFPPSKG